MIIPLYLCDGISVSTIFFMINLNRNCLLLKNVKHANLLVDLSDALVLARIESLIAYGYSVCLRRFHFD